MAKILVTGSNGQLGNEIRQIYLNYPNFEFSFHDVDTLDISNEDSLISFFKKEQPSWIVNCAAYTAVDKAESDYEKALLINGKAVENISKAANEIGCKIIHVSTDYVFDGKKNIPYVEDDATNPISSYGKSKLAGEAVLKNNENAIIIRTAWLYSSFGNNFVKTMIRLGNDKEQLNVVFDQVGSPTYAGDLAKAILDIIDSKIFKPGIFHYSNEGVCSWYDFSREIMKLAKLKCKVFPIETSQYPTPATRPSYSVFNKNKIKNVYKIEIPWWNDSLNKCIELLLK